MSLDIRCLDAFHEAIEMLRSGFAGFPPVPSDLDPVDLRRVLLEVAGRLHDNFPYHHPYYLGQMLKPPHPVARYAYALSLWINPNNHAVDGGRASSAMEKTVFVSMPMPPTAATSCSWTTSIRRPERPSIVSGRSTPSSSIRTSTGSSPTACAHA